MLRQHIDNADFTHALGKSADAVTLEIFPPGFLECFWVPVGVGRGWRHVQEAASGAEELLGACFRIHKSLRLQSQISRRRTYSVGREVKPVRDIGTCSKNDRITLGPLMVFRNEEREVEDLVKERDPAVSSRVVGSHFLWRVEIAQFVGSGQRHCFFVGLRFGWGRSARRRHTR